MMKQNIRTFLLKLISTITLSFLFVVGNANAWNLKEAAAPYKGTTIRIIGEALAPLESLNQQKKIFEDETGIKVIIEQQAFDQVIEKTTADFVGGTGIYDAILNPHVKFPFLVSNGWITPIDKMLKNKKLADPNFKLKKEVLSNDWLMASMGQNGDLYGVPFSAHTIYLNWRWDLFEHPDEQKNFKAKYGYDLPSPAITMDHLRDTAEFFTRKKGEKLAGETLTQDVFGIANSGKRHISMLWNYYNFLYAFDGKVVDSSNGPDYGKVVINNKAGVDSLNYYKDLLVNYGPTGSLDYTWDEQMAAMQSGLAVQSLLWADASYGISHDPESSKTVGKVAYSGTPIGKRKIVNLHQWGMFLPTSSKNPEAAWLFMQWTQRPEIQEKLMSTGSISLSKSTYQQKSVQDLVYADTNYFILSGGDLPTKGKFRKNGSPYGMSKEYANAKDPVTGKNAAVIFKLENFPESAQVEEILMKHISGVLAGQMSAQQGLDKAVAEIYAEIPALAKYK